MQYDMLVDAPYAMTSDELIVAVLATRKDIPKDEWPAFRSEYFSKGQPCLRVSPLVKTMGWAKYRDLVGDDDVRKIHGMRNKRAN